jgi:hypothetical protein
MQYGIIKSHVQAVVTVLISSGGAEGGIHAELVRSALVNRKCRRSGAMSDALIHSFAGCARLPGSYLLSTLRGSSMSD